MRLAGVAQPNPRGVKSALVEDASPEGRLIWAGPLKPDIYTGVPLRRGQPHMMAIYRDMRRSVNDSTK